MSKKKISKSIVDYAGLLAKVKARIHHAQVKAVFAANAELIRLYWDIGRMLDERQSHEGYGTAVIPRLAKDLNAQLTSLKGFSERNIKRMLGFYRAYAHLAEVVPQLVAQPLNPPVVPQLVAQLSHRQVLPQAVAKAAPKKVLPPSVAKAAAKNTLPQAVAKLQESASGTTADDSILWSIPWGHHAVLLSKIKNLDDRLWYMRQTIENGWSRSVLMFQIGKKAHARHGKAITNVPALLPAIQSDLIVQTLKDPYIFDFLTLAEPFQEKELEAQLLRHLERFLLELGKGFAFVGRQYRIEVGDDDYSIDLLFYHLKLRCYVVIDLKTGAFHPDYVGKMNFYLNVVDDRLRHPADARSIGLILCQERNRVVAEYALRGLDAPIGVSEYELARALPRELQSSLPTIEAIEAELATTAKPTSKANPKSPSKKKAKL